MPVNDSANEISSAQNYINYNNDNKTGMGWLLPLLLLVFAAGLILYFIKGDSDNIASAPQFENEITDTSNITSANKTSNDSSRRHHVQIQLKDTAITVFKGGMEYSLVLFVSSKSKANKPFSRSFNFDSLAFKDHSAQLDSVSMHEIKNVATILKAYPGARIKINCYTDKTNNASADLRLSEDRAHTVAAALENDGANAKQIIAVNGLGSKYAVFNPDASEEQRARDRRVTIDVLEK
jgi:outer membrane protein OmpA-like peptidoglycan-associated protein